MSPEKLKFLVDVGVGKKKVRVIEDILGKYSDKLANNFCVFRKGRLRIRR